MVALWLKPSKTGNSASHSRIWAERIHSPARNACSQIVTTVSGSKETMLVARGQRRWSAVDLVLHPELTSDRLIHTPQYLLCFLRATSCAEEHGGQFGSCFPFTCVQECDESMKSSEGGGCPKAKVSVDAKSPLRFSRDSNYSRSPGPICFCERLYPSTIASVGKCRALRRKILREIQRRASSKIVGYCQLRAQIEAPRRSCWKVNYN